MNLKSLLAVAAFVLPLNAFALGPVHPIDRTIIKTEQFKGVSYLLEQGLGRPLTAQEKVQLRGVVPNGPIDTDEDKLIIKVANGTLPGEDKTYALYCVGLEGAVIGKIGGALCASLQTKKTYTVAFFGVGTVVGANANIFRLSVAFDSSYFKETSDPIPGAYALITAGGTVGVGGTIYAGVGIDFGSKRLMGGGLNLGLGIDLTTVSALVIQ